MIVAPGASDCVDALGNMNGVDALFVIEVLNFFCSCLPLSRENHQGAETLCTSFWESFVVKRGLRPVQLHFLKQRMF
jgi:hypothetical protein